MNNNVEIAKPIIGAIILAGGRSSRMKFPKPWLSYNEKHTFLSQIISQYERFGCDKIIVVLNHKFYEDWNSKLSELSDKCLFVKNTQPDLGRNYSLQLAVNELQEIDYTFLQNVDNPFVDNLILNKLYNKRNPLSYVSPVYKGKGGHPILLPNYILSKMNYLKGNLKEFLQKEPRITVEIEDDKFLCNINTPEEYEKAFSVLSVV